MNQFDEILLKLTNDAHYCYRCENKWCCPGFPSAFPDNCDDFQEEIEEGFQEEFEEDD